MHHLGRAMAHYCRFCEKVFNRSSNRCRHEKQNCPKRFVEEEDDGPYATEEETMKDGKSDKSLLTRNRKIKKRKRRRKINK